MPSLSPIERALRERIMHTLAERAVRNGGYLSRDELSALIVDGKPRRIIDQSKGIWNPVELDATLTIVSSPDGPYADRDIDGGMMRYAYRAGSKQGDNRKLREARNLAAPLILLRKIAPKEYVPIFPVYVVGDDPEEGYFIIALDEALRFFPEPELRSIEARRYAERIVRARLHQPTFRARVIHAYSRQCAMCALRHAELLDAAHIIRDSDDWGEPVVQNGLSLCKIHHAAYDQNLLGVTPTYQVRVKSSILEETDGPMLRHGLQEMHERHLILPAPRNRPDQDRLAQRFEEFLSAS